ncbi:jumonji superfamily protein [Gymnopilus junonius]|uniref:[histone H3]-trimethyl-L-lysine(4) demethylase n=1 Tax=Gymnopilus junonius TaxID=109634 RepID=A0A9P5P215_GYMJU|nr:jumonji superfamily protein [Gymnopilus junonius]
MHGSPSSTVPRGTPSRRGKSPRHSSDSLPQAGSSTLSTNFSNKPATAFISSLDIPVQGAIPIESEISKGSATIDASQPTSVESKRAPRKSKTDALAALNNQARSSSTGPDDMDVSEDLTERYRNASPIPVPARLDLSTVKTNSSRVAKDIHSEPRLFGLTDCPEFYPTVEEFKDPMAYIKSICPSAQEYGICKIVPPEDWQMPFVTDTENFRFKTRLQRLNSIEASSRAKLNFLEQLYQFHKQQGNSRVVVPTINHKPLDLWLLRKEVQRLGGYDAVTKGKKWSDLGRILGYRGIPGLSTQIKNSYTRVILPFEHFCERARNSPAMSPARDAHLKTHINIQKPSRLSTSVTASGDTSPPASPLTTTSSPLSEPPDESESKDATGKPNSKSRRSARIGSQSQEQSPQKPVSSVADPPPIPPPVFYDKEKPDMKIGTPEVRFTDIQAQNNPSPTTYREQQHCEICHKKNRGEEMLLCDGCDCGFHMFCLDPPLESIPKDQWFCFTCLAGTGGDFGFDEGEEHSLSSFQARDREFRRLWFESHPPANADILPDDGDSTKTRIGNVTVSENDVEEEFWRLVQSPNETVEIEYGADVHSTTHGSAMPTMETHPLDQYSKDPWNLNNMPILPDSLLRFIKSDISGMTVPWTYVGMAFSTFCWHNEDHYTYSINYMHWGETKTWYGIPGQDADKFEAAIKCEAPDLFEAQPDLLFQLVTLMNPQRLTDAGVRVYACNQRPREFVITFPKAYHAGFNHGFNFNEAVNFALPDWLPLGRDCVQRYREHRKLPVFSHDELLITITQQSQSIKTAMWLIDSLKEMTDREMADREKARAQGLGEILEEEDRPEDQYQCNICKAFCYLSQVTCQCSTKVVCVDHAELLCENHALHHLILRKRFSDEDLQETYNKFAERAAIPSAWQSKLSKLLSESARPALRSLRALLAEGDRINYPLPELASLRKCVARANEWVDSANSFIIRKQSRKRSRRSRGRPSGADTLGTSDDPGDRPDRGLDDLYGLLREVETLGFDCPEIGVLKVLAQQAEETKVKASALLSAPPPDQEREEFLQECKRLLLHGSSINVLLEELVEVEKIVEQEQLVNELEEKLEEPDASVTLEEVRQFLTRARMCGLPSDNKYVKMLDARQREGDDWEARARSVLEQPIKTIEELEVFADMDPSIPIDPTVLNRLMTARAKALDFEKQAKAWLAYEPGGPKARLPDVMRLASRASKDFSIYSVQLLKRSADIAADLESRCENVLRNRYPSTEEDVFQAISKWKAYAQEHLSMFALPTFEKLEVQLRLHENWIKDIPWYCAEHKETHSQQVLQDVLENTQPDEDLPPADEFFTCICNTPVRPPPNGAQSDAVQCDHCFARFHGDCAKNGGSCPFCDHHHWNGAIHKQRSYHFCYLPTILANAPEISKNYSEDYKQLEIIVHRVDRLSAVIGQFLSYTSVSENQRPEYIPQVRHYMRKLYKIQFAVSPNPDISFGLDLAGLHRILAARPLQTRPKKRRKPRFTFGQDVDQDAKDGTRCICRGRNPFFLGIPAIECESCNKRYHIGCVSYPGDKVTPSMRFICPICCLRKGKAYQYSEVRVTPGDSLLPEKQPSDTFVNTKDMLDSFSKMIILKKLAPAHMQALTVELVAFQPGSDSDMNSSPSYSSSGSALSRPPMINHQSAPPRSHPANGAGHFPTPQHSPHNSVHHSPPGMNAFGTPGQGPNGHLPPPPWSRWGTMSTPSMPPSTQRRTSATNGDSSRTNGTPQPPNVMMSLDPPISRKRKHVEDLPHQLQPHGGHPHQQHYLPPSEDDVRINNSYPLKRHAGPALTPTPLSPPMPAQQTLSPSLAMIMSPTNQAVHTSSPRGNQLPPLRTGPGGSPLLPPVKSLISGEPRPL